MKNLVICLVSILLMSCGDSSKSLFSVWTGVDEGETIDLTAAQIGDNVLGIVLQDGTLCTMDITVGGDGASGPFVISNDDCMVFDGSYSYSVQSSVLSLCNGNECFDYK